MRSLALFLAIPAMAACQNASKLDHVTGSSSPSLSGPAAPRVVATPAKLEFFVMSKCPYGVQVEKAVAPVLAKLGGNVDFHISFIGQKQGDELTSMHGPAEVTGDMAQLCARDIAPDKYVAMIACQDNDPQHMDTNWDICGTQNGIDSNKIKECMATKGKELLAASFDEADKRGATGSPTMFLNGKPYEGGRKPNDFLKAICNSFDPAGKKPADCENLPVPVAVNATFFSDKRCEKCNIDGLEGQLASVFEGIKVTKVDYMSPEGKALYAKLKAADPTFKTLPAILFDKSLDGDADGKAQVQKYLKPLGDYQTLALGGNFDPTAEICDNKTDDDANGKSDCDDATCKEAMVCREEIKKSLDLFVMSHCPYGTKAMLATKEFSTAFGKDATINVHFIGDMKNGEPNSMHGPDEVNDDLREVCAIQHYNDKFLDFLACRSKDLNADWKTCTGGTTGIDTAVISKCVEGEEGHKLLAASFQVASALDIGSSPTFLLNNRETFNAQTAADIGKHFCEKNPGLAGCTKALTDAPAQAAGGAACGTN